MRKPRPGLAAREVSDWLDGGPEPDPLRLAQAIRSADQRDRCVQVLMGHAALDSEFGAGPPGDAFTRRVMHAVGQEENVRRVRRRRLVFGIGLGAAVAAACVIAAVLFWPEAARRAPKDGTTPFVQSPQRRELGPKQQEPVPGPGWAQVIEGSLTVLADGTVLHTGEYVDPDTTLVTRPEQVATLCLPDGSLVDLRGACRIAVGEPSGMRRAGVRVDQGRALFTVTRQGGRFRVDTPAGHVVVLGTQFSVEVDYENDRGDVAADQASLRGKTWAQMAVEVLWGKVRASDGRGTSADLTTGQWLAASANRAVKTVAYQGEPGTEDLADQPIAADRRPGRLRRLAGFDHDRDGTLSRVERARACAETGEAANRRLVAQFDSDDDGQLSRAERSDAVGQAGRGHRQRVMGQYDTDNDGQLDADEARQAREGRRRQWREGTQARPGPRQKPARRKAQPETGAGEPPGEDLAPSMRDRDGRTVRPDRDRPGYAPSKRDVDRRKRTGPTSQEAATQPDDESGKHKAKRDRRRRPHGPPGRPPGRGRQHGRRPGRLPRRKPGRHERR